MVQCPIHTNNILDLIHHVLDVHKPESGFPWSMFKNLSVEVVNSPHVVAQGFVNEKYFLSRHFNWKSGVPLNVNRLIKIGKVAELYQKFIQIIRQNEQYLTNFHKIEKEELESVFDNILLNLHQVHKTHPNSTDQRVVEILEEELLKLFVKALIAYNQICRIGNEYLVSLDELEDIHQTLSNLIGSRRNSIKDYVGMLIRNGEIQKKDEKEVADFLEKEWIQSKTKQLITYKDNDIESHGEETVSNVQYIKGSDSLFTTLNNIKKLIQSKMSSGKTWSEALETMIEHFQPEFYIPCSPEVDKENRVCYKREVEQSDSRIYKELRFDFRARYRI